MAIIMGSSADTNLLDFSDLTDEAFVHHAYIEAFGRPCNLDEATRAISQLASGHARASLWRNIQAVALRWQTEPASRLQFRLEMLLAREDHEFLLGAYRLLLGRQVDREGLSHYMSALRGGRGRIEILRSIARSDEARARLGAAAVAASLESMVEPSPTRSAQPLSVSDLRELGAMDSTNFLYQAYRVILGREIDAGGRDHYSRRLAVGVTRQRVIAELSLSREALLRPRTLAASMMVHVMRKL
ncbi:hypothetical protein GALL_316010 [mine drainage metagenome]|jgi:hypothetical protein|uniref:DUF4214 domain-containing protein n=1 Tax=mine drainage metagenome TaxID=410659 RepID=A0A1J5REH0_9ZZZZ